MNRKKLIYAAITKKHKTDLQYKFELMEVKWQYSRFDLLELINPSIPHSVKRIDVYTLGKEFETMSKADFVYFGRLWESDVRTKLMNDYCALLGIPFTCRLGEIPKGVVL